jgi:hypothetical protein
LDQGYMMGVNRFCGTLNAFNASTLLQGSKSISKHYMMGEHNGNI